MTQIPSYGEIISLVFPVLLILLIGVFVRAGSLINQSTTTHLPKLVIYLLYPCLLLDTTLSSNALKDFKNLFLAPLFGFLCVAIGVLLSYLLLKKAFKQETPHRAFAFTTGIFNFSYIPIPICIALFDTNTLAVLMTFCVGVELAIWSIGIFILTGKREEKAWKQFINPPLITLLIAIPIVITQTQEYIPQPLLTSIDLLGASSIPIGLLAIGATLYDLGKNTFNSIRIKPCIWSVILRCGVFPVLFISFALFFPVGNELQNVLLLQAAMPCGIFPIVIAKHYSSDSSLSFQIVVATTAFSLITAPAWLHFGIRLASNG